MINIASKLLPDTNTIETAINELNDKILSLELIENLLKFYPTDDEYDNLKELQEQSKKENKELNLEKADELVANLMKIDQLKEKLILLRTQFYFEEQIKFVIEYDNRLKNVILEIKNEEEIKIILGHILNLGNILNVKTKRSLAAGFDTNILESNFPIDINKKDALYFIIEEILEKNPDFQPLSKKFSNTMLLKIEVTQDNKGAKANGVAKEIENFEKIVSNLESDKKSTNNLKDENFKNKIYEKLENDLKLSNEILASLKKAKDEIYDLAVYYTYINKKAKKEDNYIKSELFVVTLQRFILKVDKVLNQVLSDNKIKNKKKSR